jgi:hypothetical protein
MAQITPGLVVGTPGPIPSAPLGFYYGNGSPLNSTNNVIVNAQIGSIYSDYIGGNLWFKGASGWTQVTIP